MNAAVNLARLSLEKHVRNPIKARKVLLNAVLVRKEFGEKVQSYFELIKSNDFLKKT